VIAEYQADFAKMVGVTDARAFWKGRVALHAILKAMAIGGGDEVLIPAFTCVVVANAVRFAGAAPVYVDLAPGGYNLDPAGVERAITSRTRALIVQHTFGIPAAMGPLLEIAQRHRLAIIEDCAHAIGSSLGGRRVGTFGLAAFFSSQWSKPFTTGLGGVAVTSDSGLAGRLRAVHESCVDPPRGRIARLRLQYELYRRLFSPRTFWFAEGVLHRLSRYHLFVGSSGAEEMRGLRPRDTLWRMSPFQARAGREEIGKLPDNIAHRRNIARFYEDRLRSQGWVHGRHAVGEETVYLRFPLRVANKDEVLHRASEQRVELGDWFESVLHPVRQELGRFGYRVGCCPLAERAAEETINLPVHRGVSLEEAERIVRFVVRVAKRPEVAR
jgi:perosamine synthetase